MTRIGNIDITPAVEPSRCRAMLADGKRCVTFWQSSFSRPPEAPGVTAEGIPAEIRAAVRACADGKAPWPLFINGGVGTGKTYAAVMAWKYFGGWIGTLTDWCSLLTAAKREQLHWTGGARCWEQDLWEHWRNVELVVVDELGLRSPTDAAYDTLAEMLNKRAARPAIWISNHDAAGLLNVYDDRIVSRLEAGTVVKLSGPDRRIQRATVAP